MEYDIAKRSKYLMKKMKPILVSCIVLVSILVASSCAVFQEEKALDPESEEFLSKVRYIITSEERKSIRQLPVEEREAFIENFWKVRDPDPFTEVNEFKEEYFARIDMANKLFTSSGTLGWLQDRGRAYIVVGPPNDRLTIRQYTDSWVERWLYKDFYLDFIPGDIMGVPKLDTRSIRNLSKFTEAQRKRTPRLVTEEQKDPFDYELQIFKEDKNKLNVFIKIPFADIWMNKKENRLEAVLRVTYSVKEEAKKRIALENTKDHPISIKESEIADYEVKDCLIKIPLELEEGEYVMTIQVENTVGGGKVEKKIKFSI